MRHVATGIVAVLVAVVALLAQPAHAVAVHQHEVVRGGTTAMPAVGTHVVPRQLSPLAVKRYAGAVAATVASGAPLREDLRPGASTAPARSWASADRADAFAARAPPGYGTSRS